MGTNFIIGTAIYNTVSLISSVTYCS